MPDDLYQRYMTVRAALRRHGAECETCTAQRQCTVGAQLHESLARLQDAYLARQKRSR